MKKSMVVSMSLIARASCRQAVKKKSIRLQRRSMCIAFLFICHLIVAQQIEPIGLQVRKQLTENDKPSFALGFRIKADGPIKTISKASKVLSITDDTGLDILEAHREQVREKAAKRGEKATDEMMALINFRESRSLSDTLGFLALVESLALPNREAKEVLIKAEIVYKVPAAQDSDSELLKDIIFGETETIQWQGSKISFTKYPYNDSKKGQLYRLSFQNEDLGAKVDKIELVDPQGKSIRIVEVFIYPDSIEFSLPPKEINAPINLKITFKKFSTKTLLLDQKLSIGL